MIEILKIILIILTTVVPVLYNIVVYFSKDLKRFDKTIRCLTYIQAIGCLSIIIAYVYFYSLRWLKSKI